MSPPRVAILDYGCGNLASVANAVRKVGGEPEILHGVEPTRTWGDGKYGYFPWTHLIMPGQGRFIELPQDQRDMLNRVRTAEIRILGICLGMQLMCEGSEEAPGVKGLGWIPGTCERLKVQRLPHIGWNAFSGAWLRSLAPGGSHGVPMCDYYYCHSYALPSLEWGDYVYRTNYDGTPFVAEVRAGNLWAVQFHPEKSGKAGLALLAEFLRL